LIRRLFVSAALRVYPCMIASGKDRCKQGCPQKGLYRQD
jgi:hypothetical protein